MTRYDVAVVGLGAMGSAALLHLSQRGVRAVGIDRFSPPHDQGSSHGESRIIRLAYFEHPSYVPLLRRAYENWRALEKLSGEDLLTVTGILEAGPLDSPLVAGSLDACRLHEIEHRCDRFLVIHAGRIVAAGTREALAGGRPGGLEEAFFAAVAGGVSS
jgi:sarcosine oxidase